MSKRLTTSEVAQRLGVGKSTVNLWCNQGRFPNAEHVEEARGPVWYIPDSDLVGFEKPAKGRPPKANGAAPSKKKSALPATPKLGTIETQTRTTRRLDQSVKRDAEREMGGKKKGKGK
jgi:transcriptional regulator with XRE-family HTH domain